MQNIAMQECEDCSVETLKFSVAIFKKVFLTQQLLILSPFLPLLEEIPLQFNHARPRKNLLNINLVRNSFRQKIERDFQSFCCPSL